MEIKCLGDSKDCDILFLIRAYDIKNDKRGNQVRDIQANDQVNTSRGPHSQAKLGLYVYLCSQIPTIIQWNTRWRIQRWPTKNKSRLRESRWKRRVQLLTYVGMPSPLSLSSSISSLLPTPLFLSSLLYSVQYYFPPPRPRFLTFAHQSTRERVCYFNPSSFLNWPHNLRSEYY